MPLGPEYLTPIAAATTRPTREAPKAPIDDRGQTGSDGVIDSSSRRAMERASESSVRAMRNAQWAIGPLAMARIDRAAERERPRRARQRSKPSKTKRPDKQLVAKQGGGAVV